MPRRDRHLFNPSVIRFPGCRATPGRAEAATLGGGIQPLRGTDQTQRAQSRWAAIGGTRPILPDHSVVASSSTSFSPIIFQP
jgi:hypothetical protein